ncbi:unnamed protein product [Rotaria sp. Silwood2]|nr:unnamed protein product [Rotaria sp. Silwood2]CAF4246484.1 unnamed protein product [Rotaria sp. Silwood2]
MAYYWSTESEYSVPYLEEEKQMYSENIYGNNGQVLRAAAAPIVNIDRTSISLAPVVPYFPHLNMRTVQISSFSDAFDPEVDLIGMIVYGYNGQSNFYLNGKQCIAGDILIKRVDAINYIQADTMHKKLFKWFFGQDLDSLFVGGGFAYQNGTWQHHSFSFNTNQDFYHDNHREMHPEEQELLGGALTLLYINHRWLINPYLSVQEILSFGNWSTLFDESPNFISIPII